MAIKHSPTQAEISDLITKAGQGRKGIDEVYCQLNDWGFSSAAYAKI